MSVYLLRTCVPMLCRNTRTLAVTNNTRGASHNAPSSAAWRVKLIWRACTMADLEIGFQPKSARIPRHDHTCACCDTSGVTTKLAVQQCGCQEQGAGAGMRGKTGGGAARPKGFQLERQNLCSEQQPLMQVSGKHRARRDVPQTPPHSAKRHAQGVAFAHTCRKHTIGIAACIYKALELASKPAWRHRTGHGPCRCHPNLLRQETRPGHPKGRSCIARNRASACKHCARTQDARATSVCSAINSLKCGVRKKSTRCVTRLISRAPSFPNRSSMRAVSMRASVPLHTEPKARLRRRTMRAEGAEAMPPA